MQTRPDLEALSALDSKNPTPPSDLFAVHLYYSRKRRSGKGSNAEGVAQKRKAVAGKGF